MSEAAERITIALVQSLVDFPLDEDIAQATCITLRAATDLVNGHFLHNPDLAVLDEAGRDEAARQVIQDELLTRYHAEKARRIGQVH